MSEQVTTKGTFLSDIVQGYWRMHDWGMNTQQHLSFLKQHVELGVTTVDHAHIYGGGGLASCEELFGKALALEPSVREKIQIVSKCGIELLGNKAGNQANGLVNHYNSSALAIETSVETSLRRLGIEQLDALLLHRPDYLMDVDEVADVFDRLKCAGKVADFGVSNFTTSQFDALQSRLPHSLITNQVEINPFNLDVLDSGVLDQLQQHKVRPMAWSCLAGGRLFSEKSEQADRLRNCLTAIAEEIGADSIDQVVYAWVLKLPSNPVAIVGSGKIDRVETALGALKLKLSHEQWYRIWVASKGQAVP